MPQKNHAFRMSLKKNILIAADKEYKKDNFSQQLMERMKIDTLKKQSASKLSGGETAKMTGADLLLLDEPTAAMDIESTLLSEELILDYKNKRPATVIVVTHSVSQARRISDEVIFMKDGRIVEHGSASRVLNTPSHSETRDFLEFFSSEI